MKNFDESLAWVLEHEGGHVDHAEDPGGETMMGVTKRVYERYCMENDLLVKDMRTLTHEDVAPIYKKNYWEKMKCDELPSGVDYFVFDFGVNAGPSRAIKFLQKVVGATQDGAIGPQTLGLVNDADVLHTLDALYSDRQNYYESLSHFKTFGKGWTRRNNEAKKHALHLVEPLS